MDKYTPEYVLSLILKEMKKVADTKLNTDIKDAVMTIPSNFNSEQKKAIRDAAAAAGLNIVRLINESTAAAFSHAYKNREKREKKLLVVDIGGGTTNVTLASYQDGVVEVMAT